MSWRSGRPCLSCRRGGRGEQGPGGVPRCASVQAAGIWSGVRGDACMRKRRRNLLPVCRKEQCLAGAQLATISTRPALILADVTGAVRHEPPDPAQDACVGAWRGVEGRGLAGRGRRRCRLWFALRSASNTPLPPQPLAHSCIARVDSQLGRKTGPAGFVREGREGCRVVGSQPRPSRRGCPRRLPAPSHPPSLAASFWKRWCRRCDWRARF